MGKKGPAYWAARREAQKKAAAEHGRRQRPPGRAPAGMRWDEQLGWVPKQQSRVEEAPGALTPVVDQTAMRRSARLAHKMLHVSDEWLAKEHPNLHHVEVGSPVNTPSGRHGKRSISCTVTTPGGSTHVESEMVPYTNTPPRESVRTKKDRCDRLRRREVRALGRLDVGGPPKAHGVRMCIDHR